MSEPSWLPAALDQLAERGFFVGERAFEASFAAALAGEARAAWQEGAYHRAGVGRGAELRPEIRTDHVWWLDPGALTALQADYWRAIEALRRAANHELYLGLEDFEAHFAVYPPAGHYGRHLDRFERTGRRTLSCLLYLNDDWQLEDGGLLRAYLPAAEGGEESLDVLPRAGTFVCFRSDTIWHEVLPARRERFSLTGWLRRPA